MAPSFGQIYLQRLLLLGDPLFLHQRSENVNGESRLEYEIKRVWLLVHGTDRAFKNTQAGSENEGKSARIYITIQTDKRKEKYTDVFFVFKTNFSEKVSVKKVRAKDPTSVEVCDAVQLKSGSKIYLV